MTRRLNDEQDHPKGNRVRRYSRQLASVDIDHEFNKLLTVMKREINKLLDKSHDLDPLTAKEHDTVIAYTRLLGSLKKQVAEQLREMDPGELKALASEDNEPTS